jgi:UDP-N-acetylmuramate dehydrogenase
VRWHDLVRRCVGQGLFGIENLALIPGLVGAAPIQNIGAYGVELESVFDHLTAVSSRDGSVQRFDRPECGFGYRDSRFRRDAADGHVIVDVALRLVRRFDANASYPDVREEVRRIGGAANAARLADAVIRVRRRKLPDPRTVPNAGSFFKNPIVSRAEFDRLRGRVERLIGYDAADGVKIPAARLIDAAGWKGKRLGRAGVWPRQPLVLVNLGGARARDVLALAAAIVADVAARYGVVLELEPRILGSAD